MAKCAFWSYGISGNLKGRCYLKYAATRNGHDPHMVSGGLSPAPTPACPVEQHTNFGGFDVSNQPSPSAQTCCQACTAKKSVCQFWSFKAGSNGDDGTCYFKSSDAGRAVNKDFVSGSSVAPTPPAPTGPVNVVAAWASVNLTNTIGSGYSSGYSAFRVFLSFWDNPEGEPNANRTVTVNVKGSSAPGLSQSIASGASTVSQWRIDSTHANPQKLWKAMGSPSVAAITDAQITQLQAASAIKEEPLALLDRMDQGSAQGVRTSTDHADVGVTVHLQPNSAVVLVFE
jgi:hypothetical protein